MSSKTMTSIITLHSPGSPPWMQNWGQGGSLLAGLKGKPGVSCGFVQAKPQLVEKQA